MIFIYFSGIVPPFAIPNGQLKEPFIMPGRIFTPFPIGGFTIVPEEVSYPQVSGIPLVMGKKGAFGSGEHETTRSCLEQLECLPAIKGKRGLDLGSGTGILAIAAVKLGAESVVALDNDPRAAVSCGRNIGLNGVEDRVSVVCGELSCLKGRSFDFVLANIYVDVLAKVVVPLVEMVAPGGLLLLSGIPIQDDSSVHVEFLRNGCSSLRTLTLDEYLTFLMMKD